MPFYDDHPVRDLMARVSMKRADLAQAAGVTYGAVDKLMMGMTKSVHPDIAKVLSTRTGIAPKRIHEMVAERNDKPLLDKVPARSRAMLALGPDDVAKFYTSFVGWCDEFAENPTQMASILRVPRATLVEYQEGRRKVFPPSLAVALGVEFRLGRLYVEALTALPPTDVAKFEPTAKILTIPDPIGVAAVIESGATLHAIDEGPPAWSEDFERPEPPEFEQPDEPSDGSENNG